MELPETTDTCKVCSKPWDEMVRCLAQLVSGSITPPLETDNFWINCDRCEKGFHGPCVGLTQEQAQEMGDDSRWECPTCS
eukprot:scaffold337218_cov41-Prasinocladus_malaysianus.AAC.1